VVNTRDDLTIGLLPPAGAPPVEWRVSDECVGYDSALAAMDARAEAIARGETRELVWLIEHPPLYTAGTSSRPHELIDARFPVHTAGRGGQFTYHGPGQRVAYVMLDLKRRRPDVRAYVASLERWLIDALKAFDTIYVISQGGPGTASETINLYLYLQAFAFYNVGNASAVVVVFFIIILALALVLLHVREKTKWV